MHSVYSSSVNKRASAFRSGAKQCNLCLAEKVCILKADKQSLLTLESMKKLKLQEVMGGGEVNRTPLSIFKSGQPY